MPSSSPSPLPADLVALIRSSAGVASFEVIRATQGGNSHLTAHARLNSAPVVVKAARSPARREELRREQIVLTQLGQDVPHARVTMSVDDGDWLALVLTEQAGAPGAQLFAAHSDEIARAYAELGCALAHVHSARIESPDARIAQRVSSRIAQIPSLGLSSTSAHALEAAMRHRVWGEGAQLVHGDPGLHNLLWHEGKITALLDWEWAGIGNSQLDLAWLRWTQRWRAMPDRMWRAFLDAYVAAGGVAREPSHDEWRALSVGWIGLILIRSRENAAALAEWRKRLAWTLAL